MPRSALHTAHAEHGNARIAKAKAQPAWRKGHRPDMPDAMQRELLKKKR
jgi:hypothetical protein